MVLGERYEAKKMISFCHDRIGLSNRIKNILSCHRFAEEVEVYWTSQTSFFKYAPLNYYFPELKAIHDIRGKSYRQSWRLATREGDVPPNFSNKTRVYEKISGRKLQPAIPDGSSIDFEYHRIPQKLKKEYTDIIKSIKISDEILDLTSKYQDNHFTNKTISVHIRTFKDSKNHGNTFYPGLERYYKLMDKCDDNDFFVASDDINVITAMKNRYGSDRVISRDRQDQRSDDFVDLLLLSRTNKIIGSPWSTFTEVAWWLGGADKDVVIPWKEREWYNY